MHVLMLSQIADNSRAEHLLLVSGGWRGLNYCETSRICQPRSRAWQLQALECAKLPNIVNNSRAKHLSVVK